jgi:hypothetical protein
MKARTEEGGKEIAGQCDDRRFSYAFAVFSSLFSVISVAYLS